MTIALHNRCTVPYTLFNARIFITALAGLIWMGWSLAAGALTPVTLQLKWSHAFQFAGYYAAKELGYYQEAGLDVRIKTAHAAINPVDEVVSGRAQFGVGSSSLLLARQAGKPVVVLAVIFQHSPQILIASQFKQNQSIHDLAGRQVMLEPQSEELIAYLRRERVHVEEMRLLSHSQTIKELMEGRVAVMSAYSSYEPYLLNQAGIAYQMYTPRSSGIDFYGDNLFTSEQQVRDYPQQVEAFRAASLRGWQYAMLHPEEVADLIMVRYAPQLKREFLLFEAQQMADLMRTDLIDIGYMTAGRWQHIADTYAELGLLRTNIPLNRFMYRDFREGELTRTRRHLLLALGCIIFGTALILYICRINRRLTRVRDALQRGEARYRMLTEQMKDVVWVLDLATWRFTYVSPSIEALRGYSAEEVMAAPLQDALTRESYELIAQLIAQEARNFEYIGTQDSSDYITMELEQPCKDGSTVWVEVITHLVRNAQSGHIEFHGVTRDVSERRRQEQQVRYMAQHDALTGLANRILFDHDLQLALRVAQRERTRLAIGYLDLDHFKPVNDTYGHAVGDQVLRAAAQRIVASLRASDVIARIGGDEFVMLLRAVSDSEDALQVAEKVRQALEQPFVIEGHTLCISGTSGIALFPDHGEDAITLLRHADQALYRAKERGRNCVELAASLE